jgi:hypothetical protein
VLKGQVLQAQAGARLEVSMQLHPVVLGAGVFFAVILGAIAAIATPEIPVIGGSALLVRLLAMAAVAFAFAGLGSIEARAATRLLAKLVEAR